MSDLDAMMEKLEILEQGTASLLNVILEKLEGLEQGIAALQDAMGLLLDAAAPKPPREPPPPAAPTPIASYEQMYGPIAPPMPPPPAPGPERPRRHGVRRWFVWEQP